MNATIMVTSRINVKFSINFSSHCYCSETCYFVLFCLGIPTLAFPPQFCPGPHFASPCNIC